MARTAPRWPAGGKLSPATSRWGSLPADAPPTAPRPAGAGRGGAVEARRSAALEASNGAARSELEGLRGAGARTLACDGDAHSEPEGMRGLGAQTRDRAAHSELEGPRGAGARTLACDGAAAHSELEGLRGAGARTAARDGAAGPPRGAGAPRSPRVVFESGAHGAAAVAGPKCLTEDQRSLLLARLGQRLRGASAAVPGRWSPAELAPAFEAAAGGGSSGAPPGPARADAEKRLKEVQRELLRARLETAQRRVALLRGRVAATGAGGEAAEAPAELCSKGDKPDIAELACQPSFVDAVTDGWKFSMAPHMVELHILGPRAAALHGWWAPKALKDEAKEKKTEISCARCIQGMQDQVGELIANSIAMKSCPFDEVVATAAAEQPFPCTEYLHDIALFVKERGCIGDLARERDAFTRDHVSIAAVGELDARSAKYLTKCRDVECAGEDYATTSDIANELEFLMKLDQ
ncbi:unnamed protein product [Prorocentrum cordatum]|uniref:Uncharacterized protein n=1 Tax=Prorocentrum cordatum TaxID=2364126 RepID=A0ABN9RQU8_9DINO|nr:unnamed protein product [Polarella glacialis]